MLGPWKEDKDFVESAGRNKPLGRMNVWGSNAVSEGLAGRDIAKPEATLGLAKGKEVISVKI
jgi:hypothetical protein